jgi:hypothetical protein
MGYRKNKLEYEPILSPEAIEDKETLFGKLSIILGSLL